MSVVTAAATPVAATGSHPFGVRAPTVATPVFEGPFDLLLHLILRHQVDLYRVSLAEIVDDYLAELDRMTATAERLDLELITEFLLIAATLIELKARRLLPVPDEVDLDDDLALWEARDLLLTRLLQCKTYKDASAAFARLSDEAGRSFPRVVGPEEPFASLQPDLLAGITPDRLAAAFEKAAAPRPRVTVSLAHVTPVRFTVAEAVAELMDELPRVGRISFRRLTDALAERVEVIVRFLAVLELCKQGVVDLDQPRTFGELEIIWVGTDGQLPLALSAVDDYDG